MSPYKQAAHPLLMAPGPVEVPDNVLEATAQPTLSHTAPAFGEIIGSTLQNFKKIVMTEKGLPFLIAGSGTLGWEFVAANLLESEDNALLISNGFFGDGFASCLSTFSSNVDVLRSENVGDTPSSDEIEAKLKEKNYKILCVTHVDTATGVLMPIAKISSLLKKVSPETLLVVDSVCAIVSEEFRFDEWEVDVMITAPQKAISAPPGASLQILSPRALQTVEDRKTPIPTFYANYKRWRPIMENYVKGTVAYFATPPVNLVYGIDRAFKNSLEFGIENSWNKHKEVAKQVADAAVAAGFKPVPTGNASCANGMSCWYVPEGYKPADVQAKFKENNIVIAAGIQGQIKDNYVRFGHMGASAIGKDRPDIDLLIKTLSQFRR